jgi:hypothetical protein
VFGTWYGALRSAPSEAKVHFDTGIVGEHGGVKSFATSKVHESLTISLKLTPEHQDLGQVVVSIVPPASVRLTDGCSYKITGRRGRRSCLKPSGQGRVEVDRLSAGSTLEVTAKAEVVHSIQDQEAIVLEMRSADTTDSNLKRIDLFSAKGTPGEEAVKEFLADELRGPLHWEESTLQVPDEVFAMLGKQWKALDPTRLHDIEEVPKGKTVDVPSLVNNRLFGAKIVSFQSVMASPPIRVRSFPATPGGPHVFEEVFALESNARGRDLWCSATRGPDQPHLRPGDRVLVRAALVGWGLARPFGRPVAAAMLLCPVVHLLNR